MDPTISLTASEARKNLYSLIKNVSKGTKTYEIKLRGSDPVLVISKNELEAWLETFDILSDKKLLRDLKESLNDKENGNIESLAIVEKELNIA